MNDIKIFIGSSITEFQKVRKKLMVVFQQVNQILKKNHQEKRVLLEMCEFEEYVIKDTGTQAFINKRILESALSIFFFNQVFGEFTKEELIFTHQHIASKENPIKVFKATTCSDLVSKHLSALTKEFKLIDIITFDDHFNLLFSVLELINNTYLHLELEQVNSDLYLNHTRIYI